MLAEINNGLGKQFGKSTNNRKQSVSWNELQENYFQEIFL